MQVSFLSDGLQAPSHQCCVKQARIRCFEVAKADG